MRHRLDRARWLALEGTRLSASKPTDPLRADLRRLLGKRYDSFFASLQEEVPIRRVGDAMMGEGTRAGTLGAEASYFVLRSNGAMFAVVKRGPHGVDIETFGAKDEALADWDVKHRYLEFVDLDE